MSSVKVCSCVEHFSSSCSFIEHQSSSVFKSFSFVDRNNFLCVWCQRCLCVERDNCLFVERETCLSFAVSVASALGRGVAGVSRIRFACVSRVNLLVCCALTIITLFLCLNTNQAKERILVLIGDTKESGLIR